MKNLTRNLLLLPVTLTLTLAACSLTPTPEIYYPQGQFAYLTINAPAGFTSGMSLYVYDNGKNVMTALTDSGKKLVYGVDGRLPQTNTSVKIQANKTMSYKLYYPTSYHHYCLHNFSFSLEAGKHYQMFIGLRPDESSMLKQIILGSRGTCRVGLVEDLGDKYVLVKLNSD